ncbi:cellulase family glycosylhydrolase [Mycolicibacterium moriokaense]|nr:cellulase family glycosylhydrolase [Mycolicibacterium moriokaense]
MSRIVARAGAVLLLVAAMTVTGQHSKAEAVTPAQDGYGFSVGAPMTYMSTADADGELDAAAKTNATWLRVLIDWHLVEPMPGAFDWGYVDHWINGARQRGLNVLGVIAYTPDWARAPGSYFTAPPIDPNAFATFAKKVVQRYRDRVSDWEIWNEPNVPLFFGDVPDRAARYTELLKAAYPAIKASQPNSTVVVAGLSPAWAPDDPPTFVNAMYQLGAKGSFDAMAMHPYVYPNGLAGDDRNGWSDVERVHQLMVDNGDGGKKIWMTEIGAPTCAPEASGVSQDQQAREITDMLWKASASRFSGPVFIFSIRDIDSADQENDQNNFGALLTSDWQPKVAAGVLAR